MKVAFAGTFDRIHKGHRTIFERAFALGDEILIGITSDDMASNARGHSVKPIQKRMEKLEAFLKEAGYQGFEIVEITDMFGPAIHMPTLDVLIASEETRETAEEINRMREQSGLTPLEIHLVPLVMAEDSCPISSTRMRNGEIDADGKLQRPLVVNVGSKNKAKIWATRDVFLKVFKKVEIHGIEVEDKGPENPMDDQVKEGAISRAKESIGNADFGIGIEGGMVELDELGAKCMVHYCAIVDKKGNVTLGHGPGFHLPKSVSDMAIEGVPLSEVMRRFLNLDQIEEEKGTVGHLSDGKTTRKILAEQAVLMALLPRLRSDLYPELWKQNP
ncbi:MAG: pantetheine-phosphate adenylyltransferase [Thermoplasmata archaeon]|nr:pantetheine-phosphate adenylyltransferase [Thermoplasmata archaeon]